jgi:hypothetical protein
LGFRFSLKRIHTQYKSKIIVKIYKCKNLTREKNCYYFLTNTKTDKKKTNLCGLVCCYVPCLRWISICEKVPSGMWRVTQLTAASGAGRSTSASWLNPNLLNESAYARQNMTF